MNIIDGSSSGANANKFTVQKIVGCINSENIN